MYCSNCGKEMNPGAAMCVSCGFAKGTGVNFCENCGAQRNPNAVVCTACGCALSSGAKSGATGAKSKMAAGLLYIFLGTLGVGDFYLGYTMHGIIKLAISVVGAFLFGVGPIVSFVWSIIDAVKVFQGQKPDANGVPLTD